MSAPVPPADSPRTPALVFGLAFALATGAAAALYLRTGLGLFRMQAGLAAWGLVLTGACLLPRLPFRLRELLGVLSLAAIGLWLFHFRPSAFAGATDATLRLAAVLFAVFAFGLHFLATYGANVARETPAPALEVFVPYARLLAFAHAVVVAALLARLYAQRNWFHAVEVGLATATVLLIAETLLHSLFRFYQPARHRGASTYGRSVLLPALFGESGPLRSLAATLEKTFGLKLADAWLVRLARTLLAPLALLAVLGLWASTAVTRVPVDSRGVLVARGEFQSPALPPGLHAHAPWPWARVEIVPTERVREFSLGFERDLAGPILWAEKHFEGEQNLLVGQGEELLTINVPIHWRVRDAVAYLRRAGDARAALESLGYRELLGLTTTHTAFGLMTTDRTEITAKLHTGLQAAADRLGLGIEIVFVGLQDVHPPVAVAPAYQDVVSAEEQRVALVDLARTYAVQSLAGAGVSANQIRTQSESAAAERRARAAGEASRFLAPLPVWRDHGDVYATRVRLEAIEVSLASIRQLLLVPAYARDRRAFFLGLDPASLAAPVVARPPPSSP
jgi:regulator of protease activity HflC (stomatin/prohibitin superfamily)